MIGIFALVVAIAALVKIVFILARPGAWIKLSKGLMKMPMIFGAVCLVLAAVVLYYLLVYMSIIQIFGAMLFFMLLAGVTMASFAKEMIELSERIIKKGMIKKAILPILIWAILCIWVIKEVLF